MNEEKRQSLETLLRKIDQLKERIREVDVQDRIKILESIDELDRRGEEIMRRYNEESGDAPIRWESVKEELKEEEDPMNAWENGLYG